MSSCRHTTAEIREGTTSVVPQPDPCLRALAPEAQDTTESNKSLRITSLTHLCE